MANYSNNGESSEFELLEFISGLESIWDLRQTASREGLSSIPCESLYSSKHLPQSLIIQKVIC